jgi:hypothetical protein
LGTFPGEEIVARILVSLALLTSFLPNPAPAAESVKLIKLVLRPAPTPKPALRFQVLPMVQDITDGNAAPLYRRACILVKDKEIDELEGKFEKWRSVPLPRLPRREIRKILARFKAPLREIELGARREFCAWGLVSRAARARPDFRVPEIGPLSFLGKLLAVKARLEIAQKEHLKALQTLQTGLGLGEHLSKGPFFIFSLVGKDIAQAMLDPLQELFQLPNSPNLYWALSALPRPFIDLRRPLETERLLLFNMVPELKEIEKRPLTTWELWSLLGNTVNVLDFEFNQLRSDWKRFSLKLGCLAVSWKGYPDAKKELLAQGWTAKKLNRLTRLQVTAIHCSRQFSELNDQLLKWFSVPYWQAYQGMNRAWNDQVDLKVKNAIAENMKALPFYQLFPAGQKIYFATARLDRRIAALRCVEAIRLYAAKKGGKLPPTLKAVKEVPVPVDPFTGKMFDYQLIGNKVTLYGGPPGKEEPTEENTLKYELTLKR